MAFSNFGINRSNFKAGLLTLADDVNNSETTVISSSGGNVTLNTSQLTASYAKITYLDVEEINSISRTETTLEVVDKLIVAASGSNAAQSSGGGLQIGGTDGSDTVASVLYDNGSSALDMNIAGTTHAALSSTAFSASAQLQGASVAVDGAVSGAAMQGTAGTLTSLALQSGGITAAGAIAGATTIDASGDLTVGSITNAEFTVDASGNTDIDGTLNVEGAATMQAALNASGLASLDGGVDVNGNLTISTAGAVAGATSIDGSGDLTMGTITMTGFSVDADGDTALKSLAVDNGSTIGCDADGDLLTFAAQSVTVAADSALTYKGTAITSTGAELNLVDGSGAGNVVNSKAVIYSAAGEVAATSVSASSHYKIARFDGSNAVSVLKQEFDTDGVQELMGVTADGMILLGGYDEKYTAVSSSGGFVIKDTSADLEVSLQNSGLNNIGTLDGRSDENLQIKQENDGRHMHFVFKQSTKDETSTTGHIKFFEGEGQEIGSIQSGSANGAAIGKIIFGSGSFSHGINAGTVTVSAAGAVAGATSIDGSGDLTMGTITMTGFSVDADGDMVAKSLNNSNGGITNAGSIAGATTIDASGDLTVGTITNAEFTVDASGNTDIDGTLNVEGAATLQSTLSAQSASFSTVYGSGAAQFANTLLVEGAASMSSTLTVESTVSGANGTFDALAGTSLALQGGGISAAGAIAGATNIDGTGDLTMGSITMAEFSVDSSGNTDVDGTLNVEGAATMQAALNASGLASLDGGVDVNGNVTISTAGAIAGATTIDASGDLSVGSITNAEFAVDASGNTDIDGTLNVEGVLTHQANVLPSANGSLNIGSTSYRYNAVYANNVYTGDFHMKNERGDWTLFEESDHIRIRNNKTGQTFKLGMSLIEE